MKSLKKLQSEIEQNQIEYRRVTSLNTGVIVGATDTTTIGNKIIGLITEYNRRAKRTKYYGGTIQPVK